jgi:hypothetical protein
MPSGELVVPVYTTVTQQQAIDSKHNELMRLLRLLSAAHTMLTQNTIKTGVASISVRLMQ